GSHDGTSAAVRRCFSCVTVIRLRENAGAYARTIGARATPCRYIAFCDDDSWWTPESMLAAVEVLERFPQIGALNARVLVNGRTIDPACARMERIRANDGLPGAP